MKKIFLHIILLVVVLLSGVQTIAAQTMTEKGGHAHFDGTTYYVLWAAENETDEVYIGYRSETDGYNMTGPGEWLYFKAKCRLGSMSSPQIAIKEGVLQADNTLKYGENRLNKSVSTKYQDYDIEISSNDVRGVKFVNSKGTLARWVYKMRVTMAKYLEFPGGASTSSLTIPKGELETTTTNTFTFDWCNVDGISIEADEAFKNNFTVSTLSEYSKVGAWGSTTLIVTCLHKGLGDNSGQLTIKSAVGNLTLTVNSSTIKKTPKIDWIIPASPEKLPIGKVYTPAVNVTLGASYTFTSDNESVVQIIPGTCNVQLVGAGEAELTVKIENDPVYEDLTSTRIVKVEAKEEQTITWEQSFRGLRIGDADITLNATTNATPTDRYPLEYSLYQEKPVVEIIDGADGTKVLRIVDVGSAWITVSQAGDEKYLPVSKTLRITVVDPNAACDNTLNDLSGFEWADDTWDAIERKPTMQEIVWDEGKEPGKLSFKVKGTKQGVTELDAKKCYIDVYQDGAWVSTPWKTFNFREKEETYEFDFERGNKITKLRFRKEWQSGGTGKNTFSEIVLLQTSYLEVKSTATPVQEVTEVDFVDPIGLNDYRETTINVNYSALQNMHTVYLESADGAFSLWSSEGYQLKEFTFSEDCGEYGTLPITIRFSSIGLTVDDLGSYANALLIMDANNNQVKRISLTGEVDMSPHWLSLIPNTSTTTVNPTDKNYVHLLYWELNDDLKNAVNTPSNYATLQSTEDITVLGSQYMLLQAEADTWRSFVPPFDVEKAYVIELLPESDLEAMSVQDALNAQTAAYKAFYDEIQKQIVTNDTRSNLIEIINAYLADKTDAGIYELEHFNGSNTWTFTYYLYKATTNIWQLNTSGEGESVVQKNWTEVPASGDIMTRGETYAINFPYCLDCPDYTGWDYWTGKLILLEHKGEQTVQGAHAANKFVEPSPADGVAELTGNSFLADMPVTNNVYVHETTSDYYVKSPLAAKVKPTTSLLYTGDIPSQAGKRVKAIARTGEVIWEDDPDAGNGGVTTNLDGATQESLRLITQEDGFLICSTTKQPIQVYTIGGMLVYKGEIGASQMLSFAVESGVYIVRTATDTRKVLVL